MRDRSVRNLGALQRTASTSRVLNLSAIAVQHGEKPEYSEKPFFQNRMLNAGVLLKHRLRTDEALTFDDVRPTATKVILPFERSDLRLGGRSIFVGQHGWIELLREACESGPDFDRDITMLESLDELPSLDPFLMREHLKRRGFDVARCYFAISPADLANMQRFVAQEISKLIELAYKSAGEGKNYTARLTEALLSAEIDERLEPLRLTLRLEGEDYREGVFSWKGFLYYKWSLARLWPQLKAVADDLPAVKAVGGRDREVLREIDAYRLRIGRSIEAEQKAVLKSLRIYDSAFAELTQNNNPIAFRDFLLRAPEMFLALGDRIGVISHIASFWRFRFPNGKPLVAETEELRDLLQDFETSLAAERDG